MLLWATLGYSGLLWATLDYFNWFMDIGLRIQIDHLFLEVLSMNKMRVAREPRATGDFKKVARGKKSRVPGSYSRENITWVKTLRACISHNKA